MKNAIIIHGLPDKQEYTDPNIVSPSNNHWLPWIQKNLLVNGILAQTPEMPVPYHPDYKEWKKTFEQFTIHKDTILVGHSLGAGFLIRWLSESKMEVGKVALVAPWIDSAKQAKVLVRDFFDFDIDPNLSDRTAGISIFYSTDDDAEIITGAELLEKTLRNVVMKKFSNKGHFVIGDMSTPAFPELLEELLK